MLGARSRGRRLAALAAASAALVVPAGAQAARPAPLAVNVALDAAASASTEATGAPAANAVDGSASTPWCSNEWTGTLTVDLGRVRALDGLGLTLGSGAIANLVDVATATADGAWAPLRDGRLLSLPVNDPVYLTRPFRARWVRVTVTDNDGTPPCIGELRLFRRAPASTVRHRGADLSFLLQEEAAGAAYTDAGTRGSALQILRDHGLNYVRMRLWVNPPAGYSNLASDLELARRARAVGARIYLDIHYSDFWADPQHQDTPAAWQGQDLPTLAATVRRYTRDTLRAFAAQGTPVDLVSIGNEIRNGLLWPVGQVDWTADTGWDNLATLLRAGVAGARAGNPPAHPLRVMLHFDQGGDNAASRRFFDNLLARDVRFDVIGLSYYTFFHGPVAALRANLDDLATRYRKPLEIAESQYAWTLANGDGLGNFVWQASQVEPGYPASPGGQLSFANDLESILAAVPYGLGRGLFYWQPEWIPGVGWEPGAGSPNDNLTLFSFTGSALPSAGLFESPLAVCARFAPHSTPCVVPHAASG